MRGPLGIIVNNFILKYNVHLTLTDMCIITVLCVLSECDQGLRTSSVTSNLL